MSSKKIKSLASYFLGSFAIVACSHYAMDYNVGQETSDYKTGNSPYEAAKKHEDQSLYVNTDKTDKIKSKKLENTKDRKCISESEAKQLKSDYESRIVSTSKGSKYKKAYVNENISCPNAFFVNHSDGLYLEFIKERDIWISRLRDERAVGFTRSLTLPVIYQNQMNSSSASPSVENLFRFPNSELIKQIHIDGLDYVSSKHPFLYFGNKMGLKGGLEPVSFLLGAGAAVLVGSLVCIFNKKDKYRGPREATIDPRVKQLEIKILELKTEIVNLRMENYIIAMKELKRELKKTENKLSSLDGKFLEIAALWEKRDSMERERGIAESADTVEKKFNEAIIDIQAKADRALAEKKQELKQDAQRAMADYEAKVEKEVADLSVEERSKYDKDIDVLIQGFSNQKEVLETIESGKNVAHQTNKESIIENHRTEKEKLKMEIEAKKSEIRCLKDKIEEEQELLKDAKEKIRQAKDEIEKKEKSAKMYAEKILKEEEKRKKEQEFIDMEKEKEKNENKVKVKNAHIEVKDIIKDQGSTMDTFYKVLENIAEKDFDETSIKKGMMSIKKMKNNIEMCMQICETKAVNSSAEVKAVFEPTLNALKKNLKNIEDEMEDLKSNLPYAS